MSGSVFLIGMAGCGKTTVGREAARLLGWPFVDADEEIARRFGPIPELFERGEAVFRAFESDVLRAISAGPRAVVATGGGAVTVPENIAVMKKAGAVVFLDRPIDRIAADIDLATRPLYVCGFEALHRTYLSRLPLYRKHADYTIGNTGSVEDAARKLIDIAKEVKG